MWLRIFFALGVSGSVGAQDQQPDAFLFYRQAGVGARLLLLDFAVAGKHQRGVVPGGGATHAPALDFERSHLESFSLAFSWLTALPQQQRRYQQRAVLFLNPLEETCS